MEKYQTLLGMNHFSIHPGPRQGFATNFLSLACRSDIQADYVAYCDHDDIWERDKLSRALIKLEQLPINTAALYCSRTQLINDDGIYLGLTPLFNKPPSFANAIVQNIGGGNTMVFNKASHELLRAAGTHVVVSHDWWTYILITGAGGIVLYDTYPSIQYRQHDDNKVGSNVGWMARLFRINLLLKGRFRNWGDTNLQVLQRVKHLLTPKNQHTLDVFSTGRNLSFIKRIWYLKKSGIYRQTIMGNIGLFIACILKKI